MRSKDCRSCSALGEKVTVASKKGCVFLGSLGSAPFAVVDTKRGLAIVPNAYKATSYSDGEYWCGETKVDVDEATGQAVVYYRFTSDRRPDISSDWKLTPTEAYKECNDRLQTGFNGASNGQLIIGVTYPSLQEKIFAAMPEALELLDQAAAARERVNGSRKRRQRPSITPRRSKRATSFASDSSEEEEESDHLSSSSHHETDGSDDLSESDGYYHQSATQSSTSEEDEERKEQEDNLEDLQMIDLNRCFSLQTVSGMIDTSTLGASGLSIEPGALEGFGDMIADDDVDEQQRAILQAAADEVENTNNGEDLLDFLSGVPLEGDQ